MRTNVSPQIFVVGMNHRTSPVEWRERFAVTRHALPRTLLRLRQETHVEECCLLSTCNRVEVYGAATTANGQIERVVTFFTQHGGIEPVALRPTLYVHEAVQGVAHLFRVASGLDSMVVGESEILGQVKDAYQVAAESGVMGKTLHGLFQRAFNAAKEVRHRTGIGRGAVSIGSVAVRLATKIFGQLDGRTILLIGAGKMGETTARRFAEAGGLRLTVANRSWDRAVAVARACEGTPVPFGRLLEAMAGADVVITSTASPEPIITAADVRGVQRHRRGRHLFLIDIAVPRNIAPEVASLDDVFLYDIDDLGHVVAASQSSRADAVSGAGAIVDHKVELCWQWLQRESLRTSRDAVPVT